MVCGPQTHIDPKDYFDPNGERPEQSFLARYFYIAVTGLGGVVTACAQNYGYRRPALSGLQRHALYGGIGLLAGMYIDKVIRERAAKRDYFYYTYICNHPEDFPVVERVKYADVFQKWIPIR